MKVLKKGRNQKGWSIKATCTGSGNGNGGCGAKLLVEQDDLFKTHHYDYGGGHDLYITFKCSNCGVLTDIPEDKWPPHSISSLLPDHEDHKSYKQK